MSWQVGEHVTTKHGSCKIIKIEKGIATFELPDGTTAEFPCVQQEKITLHVGKRKTSYAKVKAPKAPKAPKVPKSDEPSEEELMAALEKQQAKLALIRKAKGE